MTPCALCLASVRESFRLIHRNEHAIAMVILHPQIHGHALVLPARHVTDCAQLEPEESQALHLLLEELAARMDRALGCATIAALNGARFRTEPHLHYQLLPLRSGLRTVVSAHLGVSERQEPGEAALAEMARELRW